MRDILYLTAAFLFPLLGAVCIPAVYFVSARAGRTAAAAAAAAPALFSLLLLPRAAAGKAVDFALSFPPAFDLIMRGDVFSLSAAALFSLVFFFYIIYGSSAENTCGGVKKAALSLFFLSSVTGAVLSASAVWIYFFLQSSAVLLALISSERGKKGGDRGADISFFITVSAGALLMLAGFLKMYFDFGSFDIFSVNDGHIGTVSAALVAAGLLAECAVFPFGGWTVSGDDKGYPFMRAVFIFCGLFIFSRLFVSPLVAPDELRAAALYISVISSVLCAAASFRCGRITGVVSLLAAAQVALAVSGFASGTLNGASGAFLLFFSVFPAVAGLLIFAGGEAEAVSVYGSDASVSPFRFCFPAVAALCCVAVMAWLPPAGGFFGLFSIMCGIVQNGSPTVFLLSFFSVALCFAASVRLAFMLISSSAWLCARPRRTAWRGFPVAALALTGLLAGIFIYYPSSFFYSAVAAAGAGLK